MVSAERLVPRQVAPRVCLNMMVKNEAARIERCLNSVAPLISTYAVLDTGSTDGTEALIRDILGAKPRPRACCNTGTRL